MASLENRTGYYNIVFRFGGKKFTRSLGTKKKADAVSRCERLEETIRLVESGRIDLPDECDITTFLLSDGKLSADVPATTEKKSKPTIGALLDAYETSVLKGTDTSFEPTTIGTFNIHIRHLRRLLNDKTPTDEVDLLTLQAYVNNRLKEPGQRGRTVSPVTIKKEIASLSTIWNWGELAGLTAKRLPTAGLRYPKMSEAPPFQTWNQIEKRIAQGGLSDAEQKDLWDALFLDRKQVEQLFDDVAKASLAPTIYPMFVTAAHTGARRSELMRAEISDVEDGELIIRERKRDSSRHTTRRVPISARLETVLDDWLATHPGGRHLFCLDGKRRRKRDVRREPRPLSRDDAGSIFSNTLKGTKWEPVKGWHCLRHSFISNLACAGVEQRLIDSYVGHTTEDMRRRYTHLFPDVRRETLRSVIG